MSDFVKRLFSNPDMLGMGHHQRLADHNLGLGEIYHALARLLRPSTAVVIGSWRGFAPAVIANALRENGEGGGVVFIDPSFVDDFWMEAGKVAAHFRDLGTPNVRHFCCTTQEFVATEAYAELRDIGLLMIDGLHTAEQARFDYLAFLDKLTDQAVTVFHDSVQRRRGRIYGEEVRYEYTVCLLMERLRNDPGLELFTLPFDSGATFVRGRPESLETLNAPFAS